MALEGADIVMKGVWEMRATRYSWREIFTVSPSSKLTQRLNTAEVGKELKLVEIIRGTRQ